MGQFFFHSMSVCCIIKLRISSSYTIKPILLTPQRKCWSYFRREFLILVISLKFAQSMTKSTLKSFSCFLFISVVYLFTKFVKVFSYIKPPPNFGVGWLKPSLENAHREEYHNWKHNESMFRYPMNALVSKMGMMN